MLCNRCKQEYYCSKKCQVKHYKKHQPKCRGSIQYKLIEGKNAIVTLLSEETTVNPMLFIANVIANSMETTIGSKKINVDALINNMDNIFSSIKQIIKKAHDLDVPIKALKSDFFDNDYLNLDVFFKKIYYKLTLTTPKILSLSFYLEDDNSNIDYTLIYNCIKNIKEEYEEIEKNFKDFF